MSKYADVSVFVAQVGDKWLAATNSAPYFCFEATSEKEATEKAARALSFAARISAETEQETRGRERDLPVWHKKPAGSLAAA